MESDKPSSNGRVFLIGLESPQSVIIATRGLFQELTQSSLSPLPAHVPLIQTEIPPSPPVPGLLPTAQKPLKLAESAIEAGRQCSDERWLIWPVDSSGWFSQLSEALIRHMLARKKNGAGPRITNSQPLFPLRRGIPLAVVENSTMIGSLGRIPLPRAGWRTMNLVCWAIEYLVERPWYMSVAWYPIWRRRLKRAPKTMDKD